MADQRTTRDEWRKRVDRWEDSGLRAKEFAAETGINAGTLQFWKYKLRRTEGRPAVRRPRRTRAAPTASSFVEVQPVGVVAEARFEVELANGRRLHVPPTFEPAALKALLAILEAAS